MVLDSIVSAIQRIEGTIPPGPGYPNGSYAWRNNNPGNLKFVGQSGAVMGDGGFARFPSYDAGLQALQSQVLLDASRGLTLTQFVNKFAPPNENNTAAYIASLSASTGIAPDQQLSTVLQSGGASASAPSPWLDASAADSGGADSGGAAVPDSGAIWAGSLPAGSGVEIALGVGLAALLYTIA